MRLPRAVRIIVGIVLGLVLTTATLYLGAYFALASTPGRTTLKGVLADVLDRAGVRGTIDDVRWGPAPTSVWASGVSLDLAFATVSDGVLHAQVALPLGATHVAIHVPKVVARIPEPGEQPPVVASTDTGAKASKKRLELPDVWLAVDELDLTGPGFMAHARDLVVTGALSDRLVGTLTTGVVHVSWLGGRRVLGFDRLRSNGSYDLDAKAVVGDLRVERGTDTVVEARADAHGKTMHVEAELDLAGWEAAALAGDQLPLGLVVQGLTLDVVDHTMSGSVAALHAPVYTIGPFTADLVDLTIDRFDGEPGLIVPKVDLRASNLAAARAAAFDWTAENVHAPSLTFALQKKLEGQLPGVRIGRWLNPVGPIGPIETDVDLAIGLSGGTVSGQVVTPYGTLDATGKLKTSPLTKRTSFMAVAAFEGATGPLAALVRHDSDKALEDALGEPLSGSFELAVEADRESKHEPLVMSIEWDATELTGKARRSWDGSEWVEPEADAEHDGHDDGEDEE